MKYFDKSFFKFTLGFLGIISASLLVIIASSIYADNKKSPTSPQGITESIK